MLGGGGGGGVVVGSGVVWGGVGLHVLSSTFGSLSDFTITQSKKMK